MMENKTERMTYKLKPITMLKTYQFFFFFMLLVMTNITLNLNVIHINLFHLLLDFVNFQFSESVRKIVVSLSSSFFYHANDEMISYHQTNHRHQPQRKKNIKIYE